MFLHKRDNGIWYVWFYDKDGHKHKISTRSRLKSDALKYARSFESSPAKKKSISFSEFISEYSKYSAAVHTSETKKVYLYCLNGLKDFVGNVDLDTIEVSHCEQFLAQKTRSTSIINARKYCQHLRSAFQTAAKWGRFKQNPFANVTKPKPPEKLPVFFTPESFRVFIGKVFDIDLKESFTTGFLTGLRLNELLHLEWSDIDFIRNIVLVQNKENFTTKSKLSRNIPLGNDLQFLLNQRKLRVGPEERLVCSESGKPMSSKRVSKQFKNYVKSSGLDPSLHFHSLRHSFCSNLVRAGVSLYIVQRLAGHSSPIVTQGYSHLKVEDLQDAINSVKIALNY